MSTNLRQGFSHGSHAGHAEAPWPGGLFHLWTGKAALPRILHILALILPAPTAVLHLDRSLCIAFVQREGENQVVLWSQ